MLSAYSSSGELPDGYITNMAKVLTQFPREVAVQSCSPIHGIARECKQFRPNTGQLYDWCEIRTEPIWERAKLEVPALPAPVVSEDQWVAGKEHVQRSLAKFMETRVLKKSWFDKLEAQELETRFPGITQ